MRVTISSSSRTSIDQKYFDESIFNYYKEIKTFEEFKEYVEGI